MNFVERQLKNMKKILKIGFIIFRSICLACLGYFIAKYKGGYYIIYNNYGTEGIILYLTVLLVLVIGLMIILINILKGDM